MSWLGKALNIVSKVGGIAGQFRRVGGNVGNFANTIHKVANFALHALPKVAPVVNGAMAVGKVLYKSGLADRLTHGGVSRLVNGVKQTFGPKNTPSAISSQSRA